MSKIDIDALRKNSIEAMHLVEHLLCTKRDEMNSITKEYINKLLETAGLDSKDFDIYDEYIWSYVIGFCYSNKAVKDAKLGEK